MVLRFFRGVAIFLKTEHKKIIIIRFFVILVHGWHMNLIEKEPKIVVVFFFDSLFVLRNFVL